MINLSKKLTYLIGLFLIFLIVTFFINKWVSNEISSFKDNKPIQKQKVKEVKIDKKKMRKPVVIDPNNDPLAPVVKSRSNTQAIKPKKKTSSQPKYEKPEETTILVQ